MSAVRTVRFLFPLLFIHATAIHAAPFAVQVGDTRLAVDAPPGFADTGFTGSPRIQELAESLTSPSNRILLFAFTDGDLRRFMGGDTPELKRHTLIATPRNLEQERMRPEAFAAYVADSLRELGAAPAPSSDYRKLLDPQPGKAVLLAELRRDPAAVSILQGTRLPSPPRSLFGEEKPAQYVLSTTSLLLLRGKALNVLVVGPYDSPADLDWIRATTLRWIEELQRLNSR
jgi:hypothetical protein